MTTRSFVMLGAMPIPVGHRVEVYILTRDVGVFGTDIQVQGDEPLVRDLDTGIYYGRTWQLKTAVPTPATFRAPRVGQPADGVGIVEKLEGRITECLVLSDGLHDKQAAVTTLVVDLPDEAMTLR